MLLQPIRSSPMLKHAAVKRSIFAPFSKMALSIVNEMGVGFAAKEGLIGILNSYDISLTLRAN